MKIRFFIAIMAALTATASGCAAKGIDDSKNVKAISEDQSEAPADEKSEQNDNEEDIMTKNITVDELKSKVGLSDDEYNLYIVGDYTNVWIRLILRKGDYNMYIKFFKKTS